ncbi:DeoR/GlpR transcriptional regulator [Novosphingobium profundi]|uniref:DeoR/GlpR family DNA-binding transcription regulator n=1 Tax=Novosphingobium profundi TaxID=1774954 RepID=UPI001BDB05B9|nr:DeoR/GlpR family DNA-binding transcription regulator [Novosphingobium profundi]MBT0669826.1 DeoR/GlpR transcriptional regulator [Novosphingobium profundi]
MTPETSEASGTEPNADIVTRRRARILEIARSAGRVEVDDLAARLDVTPQTIRKDLNVLAQQALLSRVHGGAVVTSGVINLEYDTRRAVASDAKARIGAAAASLIPDGASLFINIGTTTEAVAANFAHHRNLMVISNNLNVVDTLSAHPALDLVCVGGKVRTGDRAIVGALAMRFIENFRVDYALIGISALAPDGSLLDFAIDEVEVSQTIIRNARKVILVADSSKVGRSAPVRVCGMEAIDFFVSDTISDPDLRHACERGGVTVIETSPPA